MKQSNRLERDMCYCVSEECPSKQQCQRHKSTITDTHKGDVVWMFCPYDEGSKCEHFIPPPASTGTP